MIRLGFLYTRLRVEEKYLLEELEKCRDVEIVRINDSESFFDIHQLAEPVDALFERSISYSRGLYI
jgi:[lysine-biosynthesis-protein LysW]--L-2-aminoadipate ligase